MYNTGSFLNSSVEQAFSQNILTLFNTFARDIAIYSTPQKTIISTNPNFNFAYGLTTSTTNLSYTPVSGIYKARIVYQDRTIRAGGFSLLEKDLINAGVDLKIKTDDQLTKLTIQEDAYLVIKDAKEIIIDGRFFAPVNQPNLHYFLNANLYRIYLEGQK